MTDYRDLLQKRMRGELAQGMGRLERWRTYRERDSAAYESATNAIEWIMRSHGVIGSCFEGNGEVLLIPGERRNEAYDIFTGIKAELDGKLQQHNVRYELNITYAFTHAESVRRQFR